MERDYESDNLQEASKKFSISTLSLRTFTMDTMTRMFKKNSRLLISAVSQGDATGVSEALCDGADPNSCMPWKLTERWGGEYERVPVLIVAAGSGYTDIVTALLEANAKIEFRGDFRVNSLSMAIVKGHIDIVGILLRHGADINASSSNSGWLPIHFAVSYGRIEVAKMLQCQNYCLCATDNKGRTPLHIAARCGQKSTTEWLLKQGVDGSVVDNQGETAANTAESSGYKVLGAWLRSRTFDTAAMAQLKIEEPIPTNVQSTSRLLSGVSKGDHLEVIMALQEGADPNSSMLWEHKRVPVLTVAAGQGLHDIVTALLEGKVKANTEYKGDMPVTPLAEASGQGHATIVRKLLEHRADVHARDSEQGSLPIHFAAANGHVEVANILHCHGSVLNVINYLKQTPLHRVAWWGYRPMVEWLVEHDVDVTIEDHERNTAADLAETRGHKELAVWLLSCEEHNAPSHEYNYPLASQICEQKKVIFILNFINFRCFGPRKGASTDSKNLRSTFQGLGYVVYLYEDKTAYETNATLDDIQKRHDLDFLLLAILSHGVNEDNFIASDGIQISLKSVQQRFTDSDCPQLKGRTKVILANFCRGQILEENLPIHRKLEENVPIHRKLGTDFIYTDAVGPFKEPPHNMITMLSSHEGFQALRSRSKGTSFVYNLCDVLKEKQDMPIQEVFNMIYEKMRQGRGQTPELKISPPFENFIF